MTRRSALGWGAVLLLVAVTLGALLVNTPEPSAVDRWWHSAIDGLRSPMLLASSRGVDWLGGGAAALYVVPLMIGIVLLLLRGWRSAVFALIAFAVSSLLVQVLKQLLGRDRPEGLIVAVDYGSYPSGHTANAATIAIVLWLIFPRFLTAILGAGLLVAAVMIAWVSVEPRRKDSVAQSAAEGLKS